jgi:hypothetical protein
MKLKVLGLLLQTTVVRILDKKQENIYKKPKPGEKKVRVQDEVYAFLKTDKEKYLNLNKTKKIIYN